jgi:hypothetical protein
MGSRLTRTPRDSSRDFASKGRVVRRGLRPSAREARLSTAKQRTALRARKAETAPEARRRPFSAARVTVPVAPASVMEPSSRDRAPGSWNEAAWALPEHVASGFVERAFRSSPAFRPSAAFRSSAAFRPSAVSPMEWSFPIWMVWGSTLKRASDYRLPRASPPRSTAWELSESSPERSRRGR